MEIDRITYYYPLTNFRLLKLRIQQHLYFVIFQLQVICNFLTFKGSLKRIIYIISDYIILCLSITKTFRTRLGLKEKMLADERYINITQAEINKAKSFLLLGTSQVETKETVIQNILKIFQVLFRAKINLFVRGLLNMQLKILHIIQNNNKLKSQRMGLPNIIRQVKNSEKELRILILGLEIERKTTILKVLSNEAINEIVLTRGFNIKNLQYKEFKFNLWDAEASRIFEELL
ncbi:unnamed protein product [Paramecium octaurelia]|uniref:Uncharacterized protein n=1 Tax=Paramecium octaurelia TaxID=43137 RepID=A0A8S1YMS8_PAROT|nr:unnamed protein product [Paramecium octaurelia]